ncbi:glutamine synthetase [Clostridium baratii]|uniref:glutamine synthetase n=1 Tax=Clostridium baratii TaxID=1561 RepID=A0A174UFE6_9CLOT|nr:glutamine synthetase [Clostridium baratii]OPF53017.1 glutamine synthetase [Clostridium baratii]OPF53762.1 glutamine synthetase [Clostridium baratii]OPF54388.1 glutamine synthetase [Clostridium baratii]OPF60860.1 glutamine synthetase [Clostridium baratii]CUQ21364.1 glutamine synthetase [Clostridium baratii]
MINDLIYTIPSNNHNKKDIVDILSKNTQIKFVSLVGIDLSGNDTDEKIPTKLFLEDLDSFLGGVAVQTDGSSVVLPGIATLNNAKVDMVADLDCNWFVDYNYDNIDEETNRPIGTLRIPCFLYHDGVAVDSRFLLKSSVQTFKDSLWDILDKNPKLLEVFNIKKDDIEDIVLTSATELEFWVKTPNDTAEIEELSTSQVLHEHYWTRTKGNVRTALEQTLVLMDKYGFEPEMGHKEVGGIKAKLESTGKFNHITEQLEVDWKFSSALQAADNELFVRILIQEVFRRNGLEVTFMAKPIDGVAGSGMHIHLGVSVKLKNGKRVNLFHVPKDHFLSELGYGAIMGMLNNYEVMNPFISSTNNALKRLKPGFEAPVCTVTSLGLTPDNPSRNRTVLIGLIRDFESPMATRFELRSPNPHTNTYIAIAVSYLAMLDGILYAGNSKKSMDDLLKELSKKPGEHAEYLEDSRAYRSEEDVFEHFTEEERNEYFGKAPATVYENLSQLETFKDKLSILQRNPSFTDQIIESFKIAAMERWATEIEHRVMNNYSNQIRGYRVLHALDKAQDLDISNWNEINKLRYYLMKDTFNSKCLFTRTKNAFKDGDYKLASKLYLEIEEKMTILRELYSTYEKNLLDL